MTAELTTVIGQLSIMGGAWQNSALNQVAVREPKAASNPGVGKGDLFILTEVLGGVTDLGSLEQKLAETVRDSYYMARGSITASLRRAIQAASDYLYNRNAQTEVDDRVVGGVVALVVTQEDVFVAQAGPTAFYAISGKNVERYPVKSIWLDDAQDPNQEQDELALGISTFVEPNLFHIQVTPKDVLVLADSNLVNELSPKDVAQAVTLQDVRTAIKNLGQAANHRDCSALALSIEEESNGLLNGLKMAAPAQLQKLLPSSPPPTEQAELSPSAEFPVSATATSPNIFERLKGLINRGPDSAEAITPPHQPNEQPPASPSQPLQGAMAAQPVGVMASAVPEPAFEPQLKPSSATLSNSLLNMVQTVGSILLITIATSANSLKNLIGSTTAEAGQSRQAGRQASPVAIPGNLFGSWQTISVAAIAIPVVLIALVGITYLRNQRLVETEYATILATVHEKMDQAKTVDSQSAMALMIDADDLLIDAGQLKPNQAEVSSLQAEIAEATDELSNVQRLYYMPHLRSYTDPGTSLKAIVVQGIEMYILDAGTSRIYHHRIDDASEGLFPDDQTLLLVQKGQTVGDTTIDPIRDILWMPAGGNRQTSDLLILSEANLLEYNPTWGLTTSALAGQEQLANPVAVDSFFGNFYVLDAPGNRILRYLPTLDGYSAAPENYFPPDQPVNLTQAIDMGIDGAIYVLFADGRISKFSSGRPTQFDLIGLDKRFKNPTSIFVAPDEVAQHLYVADTGNQRIVQLDKDGSFVRQFKTRVGEAVTLSNLQDIYVDEIGGRMYILDSNNLYMATLPN